MRKYEYKEKNKIRVKVLVVILTLLIVAFFAYRAMRGGDSGKTQIKTPISVGTSEPSSGDTTVVLQEQALNAANKQQQVDPKTKPTSEAPSDKNIELSAKKENENQVTVLTKLHNFSSGTCSLKITSKSLSTSQNANVIYQKEYSICAGFSVSTKDLGAGVWHIELSVESGGESTSKAIDFEVAG